MKLPRLLQKRAMLTPASLALITENRRWTFQEMHDEVKKMAAHISQFDAEQAHAACFIENKAEAVFFFHACQYTGMVAVPLNMRLTEEELVWQMKEAECSILYYTKGYEEKALHAARCLQITACAIEDIVDKTHCAALNNDEMIDSDAPATIMFTSGTTGQPKGVCLTWGNHYWSAVNAALQSGFSEQDIWYTSLPLFHVSGFSSLIKSVVSGLSIYLDARFQPERVWQLIECGEVTHISVVHKMMEDLLAVADGKEAPPSLRQVLIGGGSTPWELIHEAYDLKWPLTVSYGMTETASQVVSVDISEQTPRGTAGKPMLMNEVCICQPDGKVLHTGQEGELWVKGPTVFNSYVNAASTKTEEGWFPTGDIGKLDEDGYLYVLDRRSDMLISGGENVYPAEIEHTLAAHPAVEACGVSKAVDDKWGEVPVAYLVLKQSIGSQELRAWLKPRLASYKHPKYMYTVQSLPRNATGKLQRHLLKTLQKTEI
ncbi:o-succinylbenzoate--CoA ligase [Bacillaceae bacterium SIJ1]|uniref:o-succinylbenzoate--CoA ligase n=1 Tax=Litoribacterium kuwaitense TaxID=1398745 RepID=UPI0013EAB2A5|nr:o-succinylbenzoate--CoA ligase [Litoribacterium kuwaitense]NGP44236.1 o-succinylbenzoate--CoA ligase [Litoribacterium kuwaitense]